MLSTLIASTPAGDIILYWIEWAPLIIEVLAVVIIVVAIVNVLASWPTIFCELSSVQRKAITISGSRSAIGVIPHPENSRVISLHKQAGFGQSGLD